MAFGLGSRFNSFKEFQTAKKKFQDENFVVFTIRYSHPLKRGSPELKDRIKYSEINYKCKFGGTAKSKGKGIRKTSSYKKSCPAKIVVKCVREENEYFLDIKAFHDVHANHNPSVNEHAVLPENRGMVLKENEEYLDSVIPVKGNKKLIQSQLNEKAGPSVVTLKDIHNYAAKKQEKKSSSIEEFIKDLHNIPDADVWIFANGDRLDGNVNCSAQINSILFQDAAMKRNFELYPELLICDATFKLNDRNLPLFVMLVVDGHGKLIFAWVIVTFRLSVIFFFVVIELM